MVLHGLLRYSAVGQKKKYNEHKKANKKSRVVVF